MANATATMRITTEQRDGKEVMMIVIDPSVTYGLSRSGKSQTIASTRGATDVAVGNRVLPLNINRYERI